MSTESEARDPVEELAESFLDRWRAGGRPTVEEYAERHPDLADRILELFPALLALEGVGPADTPPGPAKLEERLPERLGEYQLLREIGRGGMGIVFEAEQESLGRRVALKVLPRRAFPDEVHLERFRQEARAAARLHHTNIVPVFGVGEDEGVHYYAMQYIHGQTLAGVLAEVKRLRLRGGPTRSLEDEISAARVARSLLGGFLPSGSEEASPPARSPPSRPAPGPPVLPGAVDSTSKSELFGSEISPAAGREPEGTYYRSVGRIGLQIADALAYAHGEGILHRDIKPANLLLDTRGTVWITDFGLAKAPESTDLTGSGNIVGTLRYMAPERFTGVTDAVGDVYSLGVTLYELLALRPAFDAVDRARLIQEVATREPPAPRHIDPGVPRDLETIVLKAIAKDPRDRYPSAAELAADLERFLNYEPVAARRFTVPERFVRWCQRNPVIAALGAAVGLLVLTLLISGTVWAIKLRRQRDATFARLMDAKLAEGRAWRTSQVVGQRIRAIRALEEASRGKTLSTFDLRNEMIGSLALTDLEVIDEQPVPNVHTVVSPRLQRMARMGGDGRLLIYEHPGAGEPIAALDAADSWIYHAKFSPSARYLLTKPLHGTISVWDVDAEKLLFELPRPREGIPSSFHPREEAIASLREDGGLAVWSVPEGDVLHDQVAAVPRARRLEYAPDGRRVAVSHAAPGDHVVHIYDIEQKALLGRLHHSDHVANFAWHPEGDLLATACFDFNVHLWDTGTMRRVRVLEGHLAEVSDVVFSHDGELLGSSSWTHRTRLWDARSGVPLVSTFGLLTAFSPDGRRLGFRVGQYGIGTWRVASGREYRVLRLPSLSRRYKNPQELRISPDGRWIAGISGRLGLRVWSLDKPEKSLHIDAHAHATAFEPDGKGLLLSTDSGLLRWRIREAQATGTWAFGPPERLGIRGGRFGLCGSGSVLGIVQGREVAVYEIRPQVREIDRFEHPGVHRVDVSASGRWVTSSAWRGSRVLIRDVAAREMAAELPARSSIARFSPDERWLGVGTGPRILLYDTARWKARFTYDRERAGSLPAAVAFSRDSRLFAFARSRREVQVHSIATGEPVARFEPPDFEDVCWAEFGPAGDVLAVASPTWHTVKLWNLRAIRDRLRGLDLDWEPPLPPPRARSRPDALVLDTGDFEPAPARDRAVAAVRDRVLLEASSRSISVEPSAEHFAGRAEIHERLEALDEAVADLTAAIDLAPDDDLLLESRARLLRRQRDHRAALADLDRVVELREQRVGTIPSAGNRAALEEALRERSEVQNELAATKGPPRDPRSGTR